MLILLAQTSRNNKNKNEVKKTTFFSFWPQKSVRSSPVFFWTNEKKEVAVVWNRQGFLSTDRNTFLPVGIGQLTLVSFGGGFKISKQKKSWFDEAKSALVRSTFNRNKGWIDFAFSSRLFKTKETLVSTFSKLFFWQKKYRSQSLTSLVTSSKYLSGCVLKTKFWLQSIYKVSLWKSGFSFKVFI